MNNKTFSIVSLVLTFIIYVSIITMNNWISERINQDAEIFYNKAETIFTDGDSLCVPIDMIHVVRWYQDEPEWCIVHVSDKIFVIDAPGEKIHNVVFSPQRNNKLMLVAKIKCDVDPYQPK